MEKEKDCILENFTKFKIGDSVKVPFIEKWIQYTLLGEYVEYEKSFKEGIVDSIKVTVEQKQDKDLNVSVQIGVLLSEEKTIEYYDADDCFSLTL